MSTAPRKGPSRWAWLLPPAVLLLGLAVGWTSTWTQESRVPENQVISDFEILYAAGRGLALGLDIHDPAVLDALGRQVGRPATPFCAYNPLVVRAFGWFAGLFADDPDRLSGGGRALHGEGIGLGNGGAAGGLVTGDPAFHDAFEAWQGVQLALLVLCLALLARVLAVAGLPPLLAAAAAPALLLLNDGTWTNLFWNQMNVVALAALLGALLAAQRGRHLTEGALLALAVCAKTSPALLVIVALAMGRWRTLVGAALTGLALFELSVLWCGWEVHHSYVESVLPMLRYAPDVAPGMAFANNMSATNLAPHGLISRALFRASSGAGVGGAGELAGLAGATWAVTAVVLGLLAAGLARAGRRDVLGQYGLGLAAMFLVSSVTWPHHLVWLALPLGALVVAVWRAGPGRAGGPILGLGALVVAVILFLPMYSFAPGQGRGAHMTDVTPWGEEVDMRWRTGALAGMLLLLVMRPRSGERWLP